MSRRLPPAACAALLLAGGCDAGAPPADAQRPLADSATGSRDCGAGQGAFLRARLRGALEAELSWRDAQLRCEGGLRPDGSALRVSIAGPLPTDAGAGAGRTLRFVFGIEVPKDAGSGSALPTNLTTLVEGASGAAPSLYTTRGQERCTTDSFRRTAAGGAVKGAVRVEARGFCTVPATTLDGSSRLLVTTFDFAVQLDPETP